MGNSHFSYHDRAVRANTLGYSTKSVNEIFTQNAEKKIHEAMNPNGTIKRESCDSDAHPNTTPIQLYLDVTGSMGHIPHEMIKEGLPTLMSSLIQNGVGDAALLLGAIGDHECDKYPLQVGQFESGDAELDMWLTRTYLEGGGGGNTGESYLLAWYFAANHVRTDAFDKRNKKGFLFTIGDEPCLENLPVSAVKHLMGSTSVGQQNYTKNELLSLAQQQNHVYHIHINHGGRTCDPSWKQLLGKNLIEITDYKTISRVISNIILSHGELETSPVVSDKKDNPSEGNTEIIL